MSELREQIITALRDNAKTEFKNDSVDLKRWFDKDADSIEQIAQSYADKQSEGFTEWKDSNSVFIGNGKYRANGFDGNIYTLTELLQIYKQQNQ